MRKIAEAMLWAIGETLTGIVGGCVLVLWLLILVLPAAGCTSATTTETETQPLPVPSPCPPVCPPRCYAAVPPDAPGRHAIVLAGARGKVLDPSEAEVFFIPWSTYVDDNGRVVQVAPFAWVTIICPDCQLVHHHLLTVDLERGGFGLYRWTDERETRRRRNVVGMPQCTPFDDMGTGGGIPPDRRLE